MNTTTTWAIGSDYDITYRLPGQHHELRRWARYRGMQGLSLDFLAHAEYEAGNVTEPETSLLLRPEWITVQEQTPDATRDEATGSGPRVLLVGTPGGLFLHRDKTCPEIVSWVGLNTSPYVAWIDAPTAKAGYRVCSTCLPARRIVDNWKQGEGSRS